MQTKVCWLDRYDSEDSSDSLIIKIGLVETEICGFEVFEVYEYLWAN